MKKAVILWSGKNCGKSATLRTLVIKYERSSCQRLNKKDHRLTDGKGAPKDVYIQDSSPSERNRTLEEMLNGKLPDFLIVAEQIGGKNAASTLDFLQKNNYKTKFFVIQNPATQNSNHWNYQSRYNNKSPEFIKRAEDIFNAL